MDLHTPADPPPDERPETVARNTRYGLTLFAVYFTLYAAFVLASAFAPAVMDLTPAFGVNLAVLAGLGLIAVAFLLALIYGSLCEEKPVPPRDAEARP